MTAGHERSATVRGEDQLCGNIVLLHDGGGDRRETVRALPMIIDGLRARGMRSFPFYQLLGKTRADVMPPIPNNERWAAWLNWSRILAFSASGIEVASFPVLRWATF